MSKQKVAEVELELLRAGGWLKTVDREGWTAEGQADAMKVSLIVSLHTNSLLSAPHLLLDASLTYDVTFPGDVLQSLMTSAPEGKVAAMWGVRKRQINLTASLLARGKERALAAFQETQNLILKVAVRARLY